MDLGRSIPVVKEKKASFLNLINIFGKHQILAAVLM